MKKNNVELTLTHERAAELVNSIVSGKPFPGPLKVDADGSWADEDLIALVGAALGAITSKALGPFSVHAHVRRGMSGDIALNNILSVAKAFARQTYYAALSPQQLAEMHVEEIPPAVTARVDYDAAFDTLPDDQRN